MSGDEFTVLKLGGSLITNKNIPFKAERRIIASIARLLSRVIYPGRRLALIHGGGSFGHYEATQEIARHGRLTYGGYPRISSSMVTLNEIVVRELVKAGLPSVSLPPRALCIYDCIKEAVECDYSIVREHIQKGLVPVLYGDIVIGKGTCGPNIISGDDIAVSLAREYGRARIIFAMDVDGIYSLRADGELGTVIERLNVESALALIRDLETIGRQRGFDVTGGLTRKLKRSIECLQKGYCKEVIFVSGIRAERLYSSIVGRPDVYTLMTL